jgi:hypothetical protein
MYSIPILTQLVTFLHEIGHATATIVTGGHVRSLQVNLDGSGLCTSSGGIRLFIICGGYLGSIFFGNLILYTGIKFKYMSRFFAAGLAVCLIFASLFWFSTLQSFLFTAGIGAVLLFLFIKFSWSGRVFMIVTGIYSIFYILHDYQTGPSSDLVAFSSIAGFNATLWMYVWLVTALIITMLFLGLTLKKK